MRLFYLALLLALLASSCIDKDPLADNSRADISRLYVSFEDYNSSNLGIADSNIRVILRADSSIFVFQQAHVSPAKGGGLIYFNPYLRALIQTTKELEAINSPSIYRIGIGQRGQLSNSGNMQSPLFVGIKGLCYHSASESLLLVNQDKGNSGIHIVYRPSYFYPQYKPYRKFFTREHTMGAAFYAADRLFVLRTASEGGIYVFENVLTKTVSAVDSTAQLASSYTITLEDVHQVYAMDYDSLHSRLAISDYSDGHSLGTGRILIYENFRPQENSKSLKPTRIITGPATGLVQPIAVALDARASAVYFYVADRSKKILRFKLIDTGNVLPDRIIYTSETPAGLALDARNSSTVPK